MSKERRITIDSGLDKGKTFLIKRMPAVKGDRFIMRLFHGLVKNGFDITDSQRALGMLGVNQMMVNLIGSLDESLFMELMDEIWDYVYIIPSGGEARSVDVEIDIEDMFTPTKIRMAFLEAHTDFLTQGENQS